MKYHLFAGYQYYPSSGLGDYVGPFDGLEEATTAGWTQHGTDWWLIIVEIDGRLRQVAHSYEYEAPS